MSEQTTDRVQTVDGGAQPSESTERATAGAVAWTAWPGDDPSSTPASPVAPAHTPDGSAPLRPPSMHPSPARPPAQGPPPPLVAQHPHVPEPRRPDEAVAKASVPPLTDVPARQHSETSPEPSAAPDRSRPAAAPYSASQQVERHATTPPLTPAAPPRAVGGGVSRRLVLGVAVACLLAGGGVAAAVVGTQGGTDAAGGSAADAPTAVDGGVGAPGQTAEIPSPPAADPVAGASEAGGSTAGASTAGDPAEERALAQLAAMRSGSLQGLVLDERWVAQVASKSVGIVDPLQTAANGTHTFYAADILAESEAALSTVSTPSSVLLLLSTDFGKRSAAGDGQPYWVTLVDAGFGSADDINLWCARTYPALSAEELANACAPRTLAPPHD